MIISIFRHFFLPHTSLKSIAIKLIILSFNYCKFLIVIFVGNKCDLDNDRVLSKEQGKAVADELGGGRIGHHETSAKNNINVTEASN